MMNYDIDLNGLMLSMDSKFVFWLKAEMEKRDVNIADLAKKTGMNRGTISNVLNGMRDAGPVFCSSIARAFSFPPDVVFRKAGILPDIKITDPDSDQLYELAKQLSEENKLLLLDIALNMAERQERKNAIPRYQRSAPQNLAIAEQKKPKTS